MIVYKSVMDNENSGSSGGGNTVGSLVVLTCSVDDIIGQSAVVTDEDGETFTGIFENNKKCQIIVPSVGNLTISGQSILPVTLSVDYYSKYVSPVVYMGEPPTNTSYDSAYGYIEPLLENNIAT